MQRLLQQRENQLRQIGQPLPGSQPYLNIRPINVSASGEGKTLLEYLNQRFPQVGEAQWRLWFRLGHIRQADRSVSMHQRVRGGDQFQHLFPDAVEPDVNARVRVLWEDDSFIAVSKPAPLPVHPCGRFNRNTLTYWLASIYPDRLHIVHRLDANTTGVLILARSVDSASRLRRQFFDRQVDKRYLVHCAGSPLREEFECDRPISQHRGPAGLRHVDASGLPATTRFQVLRRFSDQSTLLQAHPLTGRTNQIRIHLWSLGMPVVGDPAYLGGQRLARAQTLGVNDLPMRLHADRLTFRHPVTANSLTITAAAPDWLQSLS